ncbi:MAG TPA: AMMECR1 domain-containing protein, partial [Polyangiaceae bacterium]|nr:AMMECR1 domain-containing protein [Polyangiaceae bacterium]
PRLGRVPAGTPIVSLYLDGALRGCTGMSEGPPRQRLARAFLQALGDSRFGGVAHTERDRLVAQVAYPVRMERLSLDRVEQRLAPGTQGLVLSWPGEPPVVLLPDVAREHELDAAGFLGAMEHKVGLARSGWGSHRLHAFETDGVVVRPRAPRPGAGVGASRPRAAPLAASRAARLELDPAAAALRWLERQVATDGAVTFGVEPRSGERHGDGLMSHGRAAVVVQALALHARGRKAAQRARAWLERDIDRGLAGRLATFPREVPLVAGTLALAKLAGIAVEAPLREIAASPALQLEPWHAAQVVCALGADAPAELYRACVNALASEPRAPWTALAARALGDRATHARVARTLAACVPKDGAHAGGVGPGTLPEVALTALVVEALAGATEPAARTARARALAFVLGEQHLARVPPDIAEPELAFGAFPLTPVHAYLRSDVTAHALLALESVRND